MATRGTNVMSAPELDQATVIEEVYCDLDRVIATLDILEPQLRGRAEGATLELMREKLWDSARRLEKLIEGAA